MPVPRGSQGTRAVLSIACGPFGVGRGGLLRSRKGIPMRFSRSLVGAVFGLLLVSCAIPQSKGQAPVATEDQATQSRRILVLAHRFEVSNLAPKVLQTNGPLSTTRLFNATLSLIDDQGVSRPYLAEALPQLNTDAWRVAPDGHMETTYHLRDNLAWQDGAPLTADDFALAFRVYTAPGLGIFLRPPKTQSTPCSHLIRGRWWCNGDR